MLRRAACRQTRLGSSTNESLQNWVPARSPLRFNAPKEAALRVFGRLALAWKPRSDYRVESASAVVAA
jgi:hypothetical protein